MADLTLPFADVGGGPGVNNDLGAAFSITNVSSGVAITAISNDAKGLPTPPGVQQSIALLGLSTFSIAPRAAPAGAPESVLVSIGVQGRSVKLPGTAGVSIGVSGLGETGVHGESSNSGVGIQGDGGTGVQGTGTVGVSGRSTGGIGVDGNGGTGYGVHGQNGAGSGLVPPGNVGTGVSGESDNGVGVFASSKSNTGLVGESQGANGLLGITHSATVAAVSAVNKSGGIGLYSEGKTAGAFAGDVQVDGNITAKDVMLSGGDCAEEFDAAGAGPIDPGSVVVIDEKGAVRMTQEAYDRRVAGIISGAGDLRPGIILDRRPCATYRLPIALLGKVYCKVDARYSPITFGDLLTTSPTAGHAMKATDPLHAFGSVIGKALRSIESGQGLIPVLVALQ